MKFLNFAGYLEIQIRVLMVLMQEDCRRQRYGLFNLQTLQGSNCPNLNTKQNSTISSKVGSLVTGVAGRARVQTRSLLGIRPGVMRHYVTLTMVITSPGTPSSHKHQLRGRVAVAACIMSVISLVQGSIQLNNANIHCQAFCLK